MTPCNHEWGPLMTGNIMSREKWNNSMARTAVCIRCRATLKGYEAGQAIKDQRGKYCDGIGKLIRDSDGTPTGAINEDLSVPLRTAKRGLKASPKPSDNPSSPSSGYER